MAVSFAFHPELFEHRALVLDHLADHGFHWLEHFGAVGLAHDLCGLEVCGIHEHRDALRIHSLLRILFPQWPHVALSYRDVERERGWKVTISQRTA